MHSKETQNTEFGMHLPLFLQDNSERVFLTGKLLGSLWTDIQEPTSDHKLCVDVVVELLLLAVLFLEGQAFL